MALDAGKQDVMFRRILSIFKKVDTVQQQVDELTGMIDGVAGGDSTEQYFRQTYGLTQRQCERLGVMILKQQDNCLSRRQTARLHRWVKSDNGAARYNLHFQELTLMLYAYFQPAQSCPCLQEIFGVCTGKGLEENQR